VVNKHGYRKNKKKELENKSTAECCRWRGVMIAVNNI